MIVSGTDFSQSSDLLEVLVKPSIQTLPLDVHLVGEILDLDTCFSGSA
jgi:hypothetical protein